MLFLPGNTPNMLINGDTLGADTVIFDLEDAVSPDEKDAARILVRNALKYQNFSGCEVVVRINPTDTEFWKEDLDAVIPLKPDMIMPTKVSGGEMIREVSAYMGQVEERSGIEKGSVKILPLIETALGPVEMTGGTINILSGKALDLYYDEDSTGNLITGTSLNISGGELNINEGAGVSVIKGFKDKNNLEKSIVNVTDKGIVNLSSTLRADVSGNGNLNIKSSSALVDGNVSGSNLTFETDHSLSKLVSDTIGDLASLNVNKGTLTYDKQTGKIGNLNVAGGLDIGTNTVNATNVDFKDNSSLALRVAATDNYGKINADISSTHKLVVNTDPSEMEIGEYTKTNTFVKSLYGRSDFSTERIFALPAGQCTFAVLAEGTSRPNVFVEVKKHV